MAAALCTPDATWSSATTAGVRPIDAQFGDRELPVSHRAEGEHTIYRSEYPNGIILIPTGNDPTAIPAVLPAVVTAGSSATVTLDIEDLLDFGVGVTIVFT